MHCKGCKRAFNKTLKGELDMMKIKAFDRDDQGNKIEATEITAEGWFVYDYNCLTINFMGTSLIGGKHDPTKNTEGQIADRQFVEIINV